MAANANETKQATVMLPKQLVAELTPLAHQEDKAVDELVCEVVQRYIWEARDVLLGRDVLNTLNIQLDGPAKTVTIVGEGI